MKKLLVPFFLVSCCVLAGCGQDIVLEETSAYTLVRAADLVFMQPKTGTQRYFAQTGTTTAAFGDHAGSGACVVINGGYFGYDEQAPVQTFLPAGPMIVGRSGHRVRLPFVGSTGEANLQVALTLDPKAMTLQLGHPRRLTSGAVSFFAGPLLIQSGQVRSGLTQDLSHRQGQHYRTFVLISPTNQPVFGIATTKITLPALAKKLVGQGFWTGSFTAINLDGGPSTSLSARSFSFNEQQKLPWFFYVCEP